MASQNNKWKSDEETPFFGMQLESEFLHADMTDGKFQNNLFTPWKTDANNKEVSY